MNKKRESLIVVKYTHPTALNKEPYKTIWKVHNQGEDYDIYIQTSPDEDLPQWVTLGFILEKTISNQLTKEFFDSVVEMFQSYRENILFTA